MSVTSKLMFVSKVTYRLFCRFLKFRRVGLCAKSAPIVGINGRLTLGNNHVGHANCTSSEAARCRHLGRESLGGEGMRNALGVIAEDLVDVGGVEGMKRLLVGVDFPAGKAELIGMARRRVAPEALLSILNKLPDQRRFGSMEEVVQSAAQGRSVPRGGDSATVD